MSKHAVVLAGGRGARLRPYTVVLPKPLMPVGEYPILEVIVRQLVQYGFDHITMAVNHQAEIIKAFFGGGEKWGIRIDYSLEDKPLGTMAPLKLIQNLPENFLVMNGDILTDLNFKKFYDFHVASESHFTISSFLREQTVDYGVLQTAQNGQLTAFLEKPKTQYEVSMGVYVLNRSVLEHVPVGVSFGFDELMLRLLEIGKPAIAKRFQGYWLDIGRPDDYMRAIDEFESMKKNFLNE